MSRFRDAEDKELVRRCKRGDMDAHRLIFEKYRSRCYGVAYGILRNRDDALDVLQEAFLKAYRSMNRFRGKSSLGTWLFRITTNQSIDYLRRGKRHRTLDEKDWERTALSNQEMERLSGRAKDPQEELASKELAEEMELALSRLSPKQKAVIVLREVEGFSYEEISRILGCPKGTVMSRLHGARNRLRELLKGYIER